MEKTAVTNVTGNSTVLLTNREHAEISGVEKVVRSNPETVDLITKRGGLTVCGSELKIDRFDVNDGALTLSGKVNTMRYTDAAVPLLKRIFK